MKFVNPLTVTSATSRPKLQRILRNVSVMWSYFISSSNIGCFEWAELLHRARASLVVQLPMCSIWTLNILCKVILLFYVTANSQVETSDLVLSLLLLRRWLTSHSSGFCRALQSLVSQIKGKMMKWVTFCYQPCSCWLYWEGADVLSSSSCRSIMLTRKKEIVVDYLHFWDQPCSKSNK